MATAFFQVPKKAFLVVLETRYLHTRSNYVRKYDTVALRVGS